MPLSSERWCNRHVLRADCYAAVNLCKQTKSGSAGERKTIMKESLQSVHEQNVVNFFSIVLARK